MKLLYDIGNFKHMSTITLKTKKPLETQSGIKIEPNTDVQIGFSKDYNKIDITYNDKRVAWIPTNLAYRFLTKFIPQNSTNEDISVFGNPTDENGLGPDNEPSWITVRTKGQFNTIQQAKAVWNRNAAEDEKDVLKRSDIQRFGGD